MTLLLMGLGGLIAALGTRASAVAFLGAAAVGAAGTTLGAVATWAAATAAVLAGLAARPRLVALPALGAAAALAAGSARNAAVVVALWALSTASAVLPQEPRARRWALTLCLADLPVVAAVVWTALRVGFDGWPLGLDTPAAAALLVSAVIRAPLASGPDDGARGRGLLAVRTQVVVLLAVALAATGLPTSVLVGSAVLGAVGFAAGGVAGRAVTRDVVQESSLLALVLAASRLGWGPVGWEWGVLAAGTLTHSLRLSVGISPTAPLAGALLAGGGIGLPFLPVVLVGLEGASRADGWARIVLMTALVVGLGTRASSSAGDEEVSIRSSRSSRWLEVAAVAVVIASVVGSLWAPAFTVPAEVAAQRIGWAPLWAAGAVAVLGVASALGRWPGPPREAATGRVLGELRVPGRWAVPGAVWGTLALSGAVGVALWFLGFLRGFL